MKVYMPSRIVDRHVGGNTTYARNLRSGLLKQGVEVDTIPSGGNPLTTALRETVFGLQSRGNSEIFHYVADTGPLIQTRSKSIVTVHGIASRWIDGVRSPMQEKLWRTRVSRAIKSTNLVLTVSQSSAEDIAEVFQIDQSNIRVIPHGIDLEKFSIPEESPTSMPNGVPENYLLYLGNVEPRKNIDNLVRAVDVIAKSGNPLHLVVAGRPAWGYEKTMELINSSSNCTYLGFISDDERVRLMRNCTLFVFPSRYEGFGFPVLEALACGAPVVSSRNGALREVAGPAISFDTTEVEGIIDGIERGLRDETWRSRSALDGPEWASRYSWARSVAQHLEAYEEVLAQ